MDLAGALASSHQTQGLLTAADLRARGVGRSALSRALAAAQVRRVRPGVYAAEALPPLPRFVVTDLGVAAAYVAHVRAALLALGPAATASGRTAAALRGWGLLVEPARSMDVVVPHGRGRSALRSVRIVQRRRVDRQLVHVLQGSNPLWLTSPVQTVLDCCLSLPLLEAVVICDSALRARAVTMRELFAAAHRLQGVRDARRVRDVLRLADPEAGSVLESVLRVRMMLARITGFTSQVVVHGQAGQRVRRVDFLFGGARLVVEVDGMKWHQDPIRDRSLDNALACCGYRVLRYAWADVVHDPDRVVREIRAALAGSLDIQFATQEARRVA